MVVLRSDAAVALAACSHPAHTFVGALHELLPDVLIPPPL